MNSDQYFDEKTIQALGYYVYLLIDPRDQKIFYVGKGKGNRVFAHINDALENETVSDKLDKIRAIVKEHGGINHYIIRHGLSENEAFLLESTIIDLLSNRIFNNSAVANLTNIQGGHYSDLFGMKTANEIKMLYAAEKLEALPENTVIININYLYKKDMSAEDLYNATRSSWIMGEQRAKKMKYVFAEYRGFILEVYETTKWSIARSEIVNNRKKTRMEFEGKVAEESFRKHYLHKTVAHSKGRGSQNPIRYNL